jgi:flagellar biosynthesis GTPase FlhF
MSYTVGFSIGDTCWAVQRKRARAKQRLRSSPAVPMVLLDCTSTWASSTCSCDTTLFASSKVIAVISNPAGSGSVPTKVRYLPEERASSSIEEATEATNVDKANCLSEKFTRQAPETKSAEAKQE